jgi:hypothetical protein
MGAHQQQLITVNQIQSKMQFTSFAALFLTAAFLTVQADPMSALPLSKLEHELTSDSARRNVAEADYASDHHPHHRPHHHNVAEAGYASDHHPHHRPHHHNVAEAGYASDHHPHHRPHHHNVVEADYASDHHPHHRPHHRPNYRNGHDDRHSKARGQWADTGLIKRDCGADNKPCTCPDGSGSYCLDGECYGCSEEPESPQPGGDEGGDEGAYPMTPSDEGSEPMSPSDEGSEPMSPSDEM